MDIKMIIDMLMITVILVYGIDISDFTRTIKRKLCELLTNGVYSIDDYEFKPFFCSTCMTFWCCLIYIFAVNNFTLITLALCCLFSWSTSIIKYILSTVEELIKLGISKIWKRFDL